MKTLNEYMCNNINNEFYDVNKIITHSINESTFFINHGADVDNIMYKFNIYINNIVHPSNVIIESQGTYDEEFTITEQLAAQQMLILLCEDYKEQLLLEENVLTKLWDSGKNVVNNAVNSLKTKISELNKLIKDIANKTINSVKAMAERLMSIFEKLKLPNIKTLFSKMSFIKVDKFEEDWNNMAEKIAKNYKAIEKNDIYESFGNDLSAGKEIVLEKYLGSETTLLFEADDNLNLASSDDATGTTVQQGKKIKVKQMLWAAFKQLAIWAVVCVAIPGIVVAIFPGTYLALLVVIVCKLAWNFYSIYKLYKQWKLVKSQWGTYSKLQKRIQVICMILTIVGIVFNFGTLANTIGPFLKAFTESGCNLLAQSTAGIAPDIFQTGFAAIIKMLREGKFSFNDLTQAYIEIMKAFGKEINIPGGTVEQTTTQAGNCASDNAIQKIMDTIGSTKIWAKLHELAKQFMGGQTYTEFVRNVDPHAVYKVAIDGVAGSNVGRQALKYASNVVQYCSNPTLAASGGRAGTVFVVNMTGQQLQEFAASGIQGANMDSALGKGVAVLGTVASSTTELVPVINTVFQAATAMAVTIPTIAVAPKNVGGFRIRLGGPADVDNYVYEIGEDGVKLDNISNVKSKIANVNKQSLDVIDNTCNSLIANIDNNIKMLKEDDSIKHDKDDALKALEERKERIEKIKNDHEVIVLYGTKVEADISEALTLQNYIMINEGITNQNILDNIKDIQDYIVNYRINGNNKLHKDKNGNDTTKDDELELLDNLFKGKISNKDADDVINKLSKFLLDNVFNRGKSETAENTKTASQLSKKDVVNMLKLFNELSAATRASNLGKDAKKITMQNQVSVASVVKCICDTFNKEEDTDDLFTDTYTKYKEKFSEYVDIDRCNFKDGNCKIALTDKAVINKDTLQKTLNDIYNEFNKEIDIIKNTVKSKAEKIKDKVTKDSKNKDYVDKLQGYKQDIDKILNQLNKNLEDGNKTSNDTNKDYIQKRKNNIETRLIGNISNALIHLSENDIDKYNNNINLLKGCKTEANNLLSQFNDSAKLQARFKNAEFTERSYDNGNKDNNNDIVEDVKTLYIAVIDLLLKDEQFVKDLGKNGKVKWGDIIYKGGNKLTYILSIKKNEIKDATDKGTVTTPDGKVPVVDPPKTEDTDQKDDGKKDDDKKDDDKKDDDKKDDDKKDDDKKDDDKKDDSNDKTNTPDDTDSSNTDDSKVIPVMYFSPIFMFGADIAEASAEDKGPRKGIYGMNNIYDNIVYFEIEGGTSKSDFEKLFIKQIATKGLIDTYNIVPRIPCEKTGKKYELIKGYNPNEKRPEFSRLTNKEITDGLNDHDKLKIMLKNRVVSVAKTKKEKADINTIKNKDRKTIKDNDDIGKFIRNSKTLNYDDIYDKDGNIDDDKLNDLLHTLSEYQYGQIKTQKKKGFWQHIKDFFFGSSSADKKYDEDEIKQLDKLIRKHRASKQDECKSLSSYVNYSMVYECKKSLSEYIKQNS